MSDGSRPTANKGTPGTSVLERDRRSPVLEARQVSAGYGAIPVLRDIDLEVHAGEVVVILGSNGAGKTTTMLTLGGELKPISGDVLLDGRVTKEPLHKRAKRGLRFVTEERALFPSLTTADNLRLGGGSREAALELFPELRRLLKRPARLLSGGEQQMLSLARALAVQPRVLLADELSLGLAPLVVERLLAAVRLAAEQFGTAVLLVEQQVRQALLTADRAYVMRRGRIVLSGAAPDLLDRIDEIERSYLSNADIADDVSEEDRTTGPGAP
jgi:branched-chain amino acid transport system ATP-binding protein